MKQNKNIILLILALFPILIFAQKTVTNQNLVWYSYFLTLRFNENCYIQTELQERHFIDPVVQHQFLSRSHVHKTPGNSGWEASAGICIFLQNPNDPYATVKLTVPELRPHVEFAYKQKLKYLIIDHRYRAEARFFHNTSTTKAELEDGFYFGNFRFRYRLQAVVPVWKIDEKRGLKIKVSDEIHLNSGKKIVKNVFEQNRFYAGLSIDALPNLTFDVGYLNWFQQRPSGDFYNRNILRFTIFHTINLWRVSKTT